MYQGIFEKIYIYLHTDTVTMFLIQGYHWSDGGQGVVCQVEGNKGAEQSLLVNIYYFSKKYLSQLDFDRSVP